MHNNKIRHISLLLPTGIFFLCALLIVMVCYATFENISANEKRDTNKTLVSIGQLKANQIQSYLTERKYDAAVVLSFLTTPSAQNWLTHWSGKAPVILNQLAKSVVTAYQYRGILLLDIEANIRLNTGCSGTLTDAGKVIALHAMHERSPASFKIYFGDPSTPEEPVLDTFVPVMSPDGSRVMGMIVLRNELKFLFQLLQTWPVDSETAESLLVTKDGSDVLFLNEPRHQKDVAARLRIPLNTDTNLLAWPAISAVTGHFGLFEANDYRGKRVLAYTLAVRDTPWSMVAKMDLDEAVAHSQRLLRVAMIIAVTLIVFMAIIVWLWWRKDKADRLANKQLQESEIRYRRLHESMMDAYVMVDMSGRLIESNHVYREMLGYSADELHRLTYADLTPEKWHVVEARIVEEQVIPHGYSQVYEKEYIRKDRAVFPAELKTFLLRDANNQPEAMWTIVRDITERKNSEQRMRELTAHLQNVREEEKANIAREIHDDLGGTLTALKMEAYWLAEELSTSKEAEPFLKHVELISQLTDNAVNVTRHVITGLRPTVLDDLGLLAALEWQAEQFYKHTGIVCRVNSVEDNAKLDRQCSIALFRIFQEALTNVARHSGASSVEVEFCCGDEEVMLSVSDNGRGLPDGHSVSPTSYGVRGMRERVEQLGGEIRFDSWPGGGFNVTVTLSLPAEIILESEA